MKKPLWALGAILVLALGLRIWGLADDLPLIFHPDEPYVINLAQQMFKTGDLNPHTFLWPTLLIYLNLGGYIIYYGIGKLLGVFHTPADILAPLSLTMGTTYMPLPSAVIMERSITVAFSLGSIVLVYLIGTQLTKRHAVGLLAALLLAISPTNVFFNRFITPDTFVTFFILATMWAASHILTTPKTIYYVIAGVGIGFAAASKYNGALGCVSLVAAHFLHYGWSGVKNYRLYLAAGLSGVAFIMGMPYALLDFPAFYAGLLLNTTIYVTQGQAGSEGNAFTWYVYYLWLTHGLTALVALGGMLSGLYQRHKVWLLLSAFPVLYFVFICLMVMRNQRTIMPLTPFLFLAAAYTVIRVMDYARTQPSLWGRGVGLTSWGVVGMFLTWSLQTTWSDTINWTVPNSRKTARVWINEHLPAGAKIALEAYTTYVDAHQFQLHGLGRMIDYPLEWYRTNQFDYLVFGEDMYERYYADPQRYPEEVARYEEFFNTFTAIKIFRDGNYEIKLYQVTPP